MELTRRQRRFLAAMYPDGTVAIGTTVGLDLFHMDMVEHSRKWGRYSLTPKGKAAIELYPESKWNVAGAKAR